MNLLFTRSQARSSFFSLIPLRIGGTVTFKLKAEFEFTEEEQTLLQRYSFSNASLITSNVYDDLARAFRPAWLLGLITMLLTAIFLRIPVRGIEGKLIKVAAVPSLGILCVIAMTVIYFFSLRKTVTVSQLMNGGRTFYCHSVVELDEQEQELHDLARRLHLTLEKAKNWGGREINPIPDGEPFYLPDTEVSKTTSAFERKAHKAGSSLAKMFLKKLQPDEDKQKEPEKKHPQQPAPITKAADSGSTTEASKQSSPHPFAPKPSDPPTSGS